VPCIFGGNEIDILERLDRSRRHVLQIPDRRRDHVQHTHVIGTRDVEERLFALLYYPLPIPNRMLSPEQASDSSA
jgi:hypothetical protein